MLLEFSVTNFRSIKEKQTLSLLKTKKNELENNWTTITLSTGKTLDVLNSAVIYGANASGKSNLVLAFEVMLDIIKNSIYLIDEGIDDIKPFLLSQETISQPTEFELDFIHENMRFVYGFSATKEKIIDEWLYQYPKGRPQVLIERQDTNTWGAMSALKGSKKLWQQSTRDCSLFFYTAVQFNSSELSLIYKSIKNIKLELFEFNQKKTCESLIKGNHKHRILNFLQNANIDVLDISVERDDEAWLYPDEILPFNVGIYYQTDYGKTKLSLWEESDGTQKLFALASYWLEALDKGLCLVLDELHNSLHPNLVEYLVKMFHDPELNKNGAQLIFVTHETSLLDQEIFRRDQVWFCEKEHNATELFSLADFKVRKGVDDLEKAYLSGRYGAVPYLK